MRFNSLWKMMRSNEYTNYCWINSLLLHLKKISTELVEVQKCELVLRRNFRTAKYPYGKISYSENPLRRIFVTAKFRYGEIFLRRNFLRRNFLRRNFLRRNLLVPVRTLGWRCAFMHSGGVYENFHTLSYFLPRSLT